MALKFIQFSRFALFTRFVQFVELKKPGNLRNSRNSINPINPVNRVNSVNYVNFFLFVLCSLLVFWWGCASLLQKENILAIVDGEPINEEDLKYSLQIAHRREDLSHAGALNILQHVQKMIDDRLITEEARRMGMEQYPEVQQAIQAYILRETVVRLYDEEIAKKVSVTEKDISGYYKKNYERFSLGIIEVSSGEDAMGILEQLKKGDDFSELARRYSTHSSKKDGGVVIRTRNSIAPDIEKAVSSLKPGEFSNVINTLSRYYIIKLISRKEASDEELENVRGNVERAVRKQKEKERSEEYLKYLRERANIKINRELLSTIKPGVGGEEIEKWSKNKTPLAEVNGLILTVGDFVAIAKKSNEEAINSWIDRKVVDHEALSRHYEMRPDLEKMVYRYKNHLLKNTFIRKVIIPGVAIPEEVLRGYYSKHQKSFIKPVRFKIQQITVKTTDEVQDILNNLQNGADFSWLAKRKSIDSAGIEGVDKGWLTKAELPEPLREIVDTLKPGDISPIIKINSFYTIIRLQGKTEEEVEEFEKVKHAVYRACFDEQLNALLSKYVAQLKAEAKIKIYHDAVQSLEGRLRR